MNNTIGIMLSMIAYRSKGSSLEAVGIRNNLRSAGRIVSLRCGKYTLLLDADPIIGKTEYEPVIW